MKEGMNVTPEPIADLGAPVQRHEDRPIPGAGFRFDLRERTLRS
jgi:hypothetical protein